MAHGLFSCDVCSWLKVTTGKNQVIIKACTYLPAASQNTFQSVQSDSETDPRKGPCNFAFLLSLFLTLTTFFLSAMTMEAGPAVSMLVLVGF